MGCFFSDFRATCEQQRYVGTLQNLAGVEMKQSEQRSYHTASSAQVGRTLVTCPCSYKSFPTQQGDFYQISK